jgi:hypothetical protein
MGEVQIQKVPIERWDNPSMIGAFAFVGSLTFFLLLSFIGVATISEAVQIFIIGVVMFTLIFRYFKELTVGPITSKPNIFLTLVEKVPVWIHPLAARDWHFQKVIRALRSHDEIVS